MLDVFFVSVFLIGGIIAFAYFMGWYYASPTKQDATYLTTTADGWRLAIHHYESSSPKCPEPVILCHGLSSNRFVFDLEGAPSLACYLRDAGYDVWVPELRGSGLSDAPGLFSSRSPYTWGFNDHLNYDVPQIIDFVTRKTGSSRAKWIGHSMGGMLIHSHLAQTHDPRIASAVTIGSPIDFSSMKNHIFERYLKLKFVLEIIPFNPLPIFGRLLIPFMGKTTDFVHGLYYRQNIDPQVARKISSIGSQLISSSKLWADMGVFLDSRCFGPGDGKSFLDGLQRCKVPIFVIAGSKDLMAPESSVVAAARVNGESCERQLLVAGKKNGFQEDYGHMDLLVGLRAQNEIYPRIDAWLKQF